MVMKNYDLFFFLTDPQAVAEALGRTYIDVTTIAATSAVISVIRILTCVLKHTMYFVLIVYVYTVARYIGYFTGFFFFYFLKSMR